MTFLVLTKTFVVLFGALTMTFLVLTRNCMTNF